MKKGPVIGIIVGVVVFGMMFGIASIPDEVLLETSKDLEISETSAIIPKQIDMDISEKVDTVEESQDAPEMLPPKANPEEPVEVIETPESSEPEQTQPEIEEVIETPDESEPKIEEVSSPEEDSDENVIKINISDGVGAKQR